MTDPQANPPLRRPPGRKRRLPFWPALVAVLFIAIVGILLVRQPWNAPQPPATTDTADTAEAAQPGAGPARGIVFMSNRGGDWDIFARAADGTVTDLTPDGEGGADDGFAGYSFDGGALTFLSNRIPTDDGRPVAFMMNADGSDAAEVKNDLATIFRVLGTGRTDWDLRETTDGAGVFVSLRDLNLEIYQRTRAADGTVTETNISQNGAIDWFGALGPAAPDGTRPIAFASDRELDSGLQDIFVAQAGQIYRITDHPADDLFPVWLNDGRLLFYSERDARMQAGALRLYTATFDPAAPAALPTVAAFDGAAATGAMGAPIAAASAWPGLGSVYMTWADGDWDIMFAPLDGGPPVLLTPDDGGADDVFPVWRPGA